MNLLTRFWDYRAILLEYWFGLGWSCYEFNSMDLDLNSNSPHFSIETYENVVPSRAISGANTPVTTNCRNENERKDS